VSVDRPGKLPVPYNEEAEQAILGSVLLNKEVLAAVSSIVTERDFYIPKWAAIYAAMLKLYEQGDAVDYLTLVTELDRINYLGVVGGSTTVANLLGVVPTPIHAESYARLVANAAIMRRLAQAGSRILTMGMQNEIEPDVALEQADALLAEVMGTRQSSEWQIAAEVPTGLESLDRKLNSGLGRGDLTLLAARPGMGKSSMALSFALGAAIGYNAGVAIFSLEMAAQQLLGRMLSIQSGVPYILVKEERATPQQLAQVGRAMGEIAEANIWIDETPGLSTLEMRSRVRQLRRTKQVDLIIVDHLQLVGGHERDTPVAKMGKISGAMKGLARELNVPVVALSQLSRAVDNRSDKRPILVDLRESGSLEQDADNVLFIYRESYYDKAALSQDRADVIIAKQRNGETGMVSFYWDAPSTRFYDLGRYLDQAREIDAARAGGG
jgi:replicative DNA helicase